MGTEWVAIVVLMGVIGYQGWERWRLDKVYRQREADLLNRLMARDYREFTAFTKTDAGEKVEVVKVEDLMKYQEHGIPM